MKRTLYPADIHRRRSALLIGSDILGLFAAYSLAYRLRFEKWLSPSAESLWVLMLAAVLVLYVMDVYELNISRDPVKFSLDIFIAVILIAAASLFIVYMVGVDRYKPIFGRGVLPVALVFFSLWSMALRWCVASRFHARRGIVNWLVIGSDRSFERIDSDAEHLPSAKLSGFGVHHYSSTETAEKLAHWIGENARRSGVIIDDYAMLDENAVELLRENRDTILILSTAEFHENYFQRVPVENIEKSWLLPGKGNLLFSHTGRKIKRVFDFLFASAALMVSTPVMLVVAGLVYFSSPGKIIYRQKRIGLGGREFTLYKFRTMASDAEKFGAQWSDMDDPRINNLGRILRSTRIDELPQLWNLMLGSMSLIGPRPERPEFISRLKEEIPHYEMRHVVPPGITGWAQVKYPYGSSVRDSRNKLEYDLYYIKNYSIRLDIIIIVKTVLTVLKRSGR